VPADISGALHKEDGRRLLADWLEHDPNGSNLAADFRKASYWRARLSQLRGDASASEADSDGGDSGDGHSEPDSDPDEVSGRAVGGAYATDLMLRLNDEMNGAGFRV
jgi:hypothetical protein